ncbi:uncharacterized protein PV09_08615 [Verruconis gallopava]|uniref:Peptidase M20 dimerisation domain-containing protein n=1 Tax=Verruconis gallopava TaxID=253628 RepID=A0A0D1YG93_9PEZI|nr:uncharacterized protein PV09_08615 [Verruconis gallopava]KIV99811.1 hypothetical protein PV09_08615 [Verruconis gallopava]
MPELTADQISAITQAVFDGFDDQLAFTQTLIRFGGQRGSEHAIQEFIFQQYLERGYNPVKFDIDPEEISRHVGGGKISATHSKAPIVVGVHTPKVQAKDGKSLILNGHVDIVPLGPRELWTDDPYSARIEGDKLYGRGAGDMRAGVGIYFKALDALRRIGMQPASKIVLESVVEEESTGNGTLMAHIKGYRADAALIPEPVNEELVRANVGVLWFQIEVKGKPVHVREMAAGTNAIDACWKVIQGLRELEKEWNAKGIGNDLQVNDILSHKELEHPLNLNIAMINGGDWASSVPAWCRVDCRIAIFPGVSAKSAAEEIEQKVSEITKSDSFLSKQPPKVIWNGFYAEGYVLNPGSRAEEVLRKAHNAATGRDLKPAFSGAYLDARVYSIYDKIPALTYGPVAGNVHGFDEWVSIESIKNVTVAVALFIAEWCGLEMVS